MKNEKWKVKSEKCSQANELGYVVKSEECNQQIPNTSVVSHMCRGELQFALQQESQFALQQENQFALQQENQFAFPTTWQISFQVLWSNSLLLTRPASPLASVGVLTIDH